MTIDPAATREHGYTLEVTPERIDLTGTDPVGAFHGVQTLRQLLPAGTFAPGAALDGLAVPCVRVEDHPRLPWRGLLLDVARHFLPKDFVLRVLDLLALHKLNVLHLHLTDDQGWRIEIPGYPRLTEVGAWRTGTVVGNDLGTHPDPIFDGVPHGGFYRREELLEIVEYARQRQIEVVPEIDLPGHVHAAVAAYPELGNGEAPEGVRRRWGVGTRLLNVEDATLDFCRAVLSEVMDIFPGRFVHCGGDEVPKDEWRASPRVQQRIRDLGLDGEEALQAWFTRQLAGFLAGNGRRLVAWDEVLEAGKPLGDTTVMAWREAVHGITAARAGYDVVMAPQHHTYLNFYQSEDRAAEPLAIGIPESFLPLRRAYEFEPVPAELDDQAARHVLGAQAQLWTEYVATTELAEYMLFPRLCAFADAAWRQPAPEHDYPAFLRRLRPHLERLDALGVTRRPLEEPPR